MSKHLVLQLARAAGIRMDHDVKATNQGFAGRGREAHVRVEADDQRAGDVRGQQPVLHNLVFVNAP
jgi:hypothetical protein